MHFQGTRTRTGVQSVPAAAKHTRDRFRRLRPSDGYENRITWHATCRPWSSTPKLLGLTDTVVAVAAVDEVTLDDRPGDVGTPPLLLATELASRVTVYSGMVISPECTVSETPSLRRTCPDACRDPPHQRHQQT